VLYGVLADHLETFLAQASGDGCGPGLPRYVERELREYLRCGILAHGFARVHCFGCGNDQLIAFSCKGRAFCPSCGGRRMAESAAHLVDNVLPDVPIRQWVISFPWPIRYLLARDRLLCSTVRRLFLRAVFAFYRAKAREEGVLGGACGAVNRIQRFGSALNLNVHNHALVLDGVFTSSGPLATPDFYPADSVSDEELCELLVKIRARVLRLLRRRGLVGDEGEITEDQDTLHQSLLPVLQAASIQGLVAQGPHAGAGIERIGRIESKTGAFIPKTLCAALDGFTLHSAVRIEEGETDRLEHLCRYISRPPLSSSRLTLSPAGKVILELRHTWRDGTTHIGFDPLAFIERLAALVPPPGAHQLTYHGVLAGGSSMRDRIIPMSRRKRARSEGEGTGDGGDSMISRYSWSELLRRVFGLDALRCPNCRAPRRLIALITQADVIVRILDCLGLESSAPPIAPARAPPQLEFGF